MTGFIRRSAVAMRAVPALRPAAASCTGVVRCRAIVFGAAIAIGAAACTSPTGPSNGIICTAIAAAGINITVVDSLTGAPAAFTGLWARAVDGAFRDSTASAFTNPQAGTVTMALAWERRGTFTVTVHADGFRDWNKTGVVVTADECHVTGVQLTARMAK